jgi:hypothetical protein
MKKGKVQKEGIPRLTRTRHFSRMNYHVQRGFREILNERYINALEWQTILGFFDNRCAFCGATHSGNSRTGIIPDHLIPASAFGELCIGNTVPACQDCNDRRGDGNWLSFLQRPSNAGRSARISRIRAYLRKYPCKPIREPAQSLSRHEHHEYLKLLRDWAVLWKRARDLRDRVDLRRKAESNKSLKLLP